jgi:predicted acyltransferase
VRIPGGPQRIALCSQLFGVLAGRFLLSNMSRIEQTVWLLLAGLLLLWLGAMSEAILMPINKSLWTPSYCFLMTGRALLIFSAFFWLLDVNPYGAVRAAARRFATCRSAP